MAGGSAGSVLAVTGDESVEAEITDYGLHVRGEENVVGFDVAVNVFLVMNVG